MKLFIITNYKIKARNAGAGNIRKRLTLLNNSNYVETAFFTICYRVKN